MKNLSFFKLILLFPMLFTIFSCANWEYNLIGKVRDAENNPISGVQISFFQFDEEESEDKATSDINGDYIISGERLIVVSGRCCEGRFVATKIGYKKYEVNLDFWEGDDGDIVHNFSMEKE
ncbi:MAG: carboxypeptidase-like regulatory domain-containing protein [Spirochaetia bacterium]|nr:carboxypeptidase-like regulatory domain-containing protein [Spirochaetia bacterium]